MRWRSRVPDYSNARKPRNRLSEQFQDFEDCFRHHRGEPGDVAAGPREADHVAASDRLCMAHEYDGYRRGRLLGRLGVNGTRCDDDIHLEVDEFHRELAHSFGSPLCPSELDGDVLALDPT